MTGRWPDGPGVVTLPDGRRVLGSPLRTLPRLSPDVAVVLLGHDPGPQPCPYLWVPWRDWRTPTSSEQAVQVLREAYARCADERVVISCRGGRGRTGTAIALLGVLAGVPVDEAVAWVRAHYHRGAVETPGQARWLRRTGAALAD